MSDEWEDKFVQWAKPPSQTEQEKCDNADSVITNAVADDEKLGKKNITVFPQGSYRNRTNVRQDSDVDICVLSTDSFFYDLPEGMSPTNFGFTTPAQYPYPEFKNDVEAALVAYLGRAAVTRGNKAFDVHETGYHVDADAVAAFEYRYYLKDGKYYKGTAFFPDKGNRIVNWPEQHYERGVAKNDATAKRFKRVSRILKNLRNEMQGEGVAGANDVASFLIESLVYNVPNEGFNHETYTADVRYVLATGFNGTQKPEACEKWVEVNEMKYLFRQSQPWTREQAHSFLSAAWDYIGFK